MQSMTAAALLCCVVSIACACAGASPPSPSPSPSSSAAPSAGAPPDASAPAKTAAEDGGSAQAGLSPEQVRRVVMTHVGAIRACYDIEVQRDPSLKGGVTVQWTIDPSGLVSSASVVASTLGSPRVGACVVRQVDSWRFPSSNAATVVGGFPFKFGVGD